MLLNEYANKEDRSSQPFKKWHCGLKGTEFSINKERVMLRKIDFELRSIYLLEINENNKDKLAIMA